MGLYRPVSPLWHHPDNPIRLGSVPEAFFQPIQHPRSGSPSKHVLHLYPQTVNIMLEYNAKNKSESQLPPPPNFSKDKVYLPKLISPSLVTTKRDFISLAALEQAKHPLDLTIDFNIMDIDFFEFRNTFFAFVDRLYSQYLDGPDLPLIIEALNNSEYGFLCYLLCALLLYLALLYHRLKEEFGLIVLEDDCELLASVDATQYMWLFYYNLFLLLLFLKSPGLAARLTSWHYLYFFCRLAAYMVLAIKFYTFPLQFGQAPFPYFIRRRADRLVQASPSLGKLTDYYCALIAVCGLVGSYHSGLHVRSPQTRTSVRTSHHQCPAACSVFK